MLPSLFLRLSIGTHLKNERLPVLFKDTQLYNNNLAPSVENVSVRGKTQPSKRPRIPEAELKCILSSTTNRNNPEVWKFLTAYLASRLGTEVGTSVIVEDAFLHVARLIYTPRKELSDNMPCLPTTAVEELPENIPSTLTFLGDFITERHYGQKIQWKLFDKVCLCSSVPKVTCTRVNKIALCIYIDLFRTLLATGQSTTFFRRLSRLIVYTGRKSD